MEHFHTVLKKISSRIRAEQFKVCVCACMPCARAVYRSVLIYESSLKFVSGNLTPGREIGRANGEMCHALLCSSLIDTGLQLDPPACLQLAC